MIPQNSKSRIITWLIVILVVILFYINPRQHNHFFKAEIIWDVITYYLYLPFTFLYHDPGVSRQDIVKHIYETYNIPGVFYQAYQIDNGNWPPNYTMGFAMLWLPFFFIGHLWAKIGGYPTDGWSFPYQFSIANGVLIYVLIGLFFLRKVLLKFFSERITIAVMLLVVLGTNYLHEAFNDYMQPHAVLFTGYAMLLYYTIRWHDEPKKKYAVALGLIMGIMTLARPSEILCAIL